MPDHLCLGRNSFLDRASNFVRAKRAMIEIRHKETGEVLHRVRRDTLAGARLRGRKLPGADLRGADLRKACLTRSDLSGADLTGALLVEVRGSSDNHWVMMRWAVG